MSSIIEVTNLGKKYNIGEKERYLAMRDVLMNIIKSPFRWLKSKVGIGVASNEFWALKDVNFTVEKGEVLGIIGRNGAGKSTLLKILSQITPPTTGEIRLRGRVGSLLEVGTGFHPELTGRENVYLNGAILGMRKKEIERKFDEIVEFSGIDKFLDTPVKRYSSGMYVRLAFAVAAHLEPEILIIDEVLAVGDAEFQKKCLGKMEDVTKGDGRTVLFVSHNMSAIQRLCKKCILLEGGKIKVSGETGYVINEYLNGSSSGAVTTFSANTAHGACVNKVSILNGEKQLLSQIPVGEKFYIEIACEFFKSIEDVTIAVLFFSNDYLLLHSSESDKSGNLKSYDQGKYIITVEVPAFLFTIGSYNIEVAIHNPNIECFDTKKNINFEVINLGKLKSFAHKGNNIGKMATILDYDEKKIL